MVASKYTPLQEHLRTSNQDEVTLTFAQIERIIGDDLPISARTTRGWWGNRESGSTHAQAWLAVGYRVKTISLDQKRVTFELKSRRANIYEVRRDGNTVLWDASLIKALRVSLDMTQAQFAEHMGVRQQTVSEWETGAYEPTRATCKHLMIVAEQSDFKYE